MELSHAIFAAGCFWGVQAAFDAVDGVVSTLAGYTGGTLEIRHMKESAEEIQTMQKLFWLILMKRLSATINFWTFILPATIRQL